ncbi:MAG: glycosyltransferase [Bacteroidales bacterium]|nr:glycosyltransferase [Bacteroidales bacterium]
METEYIWMYLRIAEIVALSYLLLISSYTIGWYRLKKRPPAELGGQIPVSILVAVRNEESNIANLIQNLSKQYYPLDKIQIIIVDDHSEDTTISEINKAHNAFHDLNLIHFPAKGTGKKSALSEALELAEGDMVLVTDADCIPGPFWVSQMVACYREEKAKLLLGPVLFDPANTIFEKIQALEFISLMGSTAGAAGIGLPMMGNSANMGFDRKAVVNAGGFNANKRFSSGDDVFLLMNIIKNYGRKSVRFVFSEQAIVSTKPLSNMSAFLSQRLRWVSKSSGYKRPEIILPALIVFLFNFLLLSMLFSAVFYPFMALIFILFILLKYLVDYPLLHAASGFMKRRRLLFMALPLEFIYPFYVVIIGLAGNFVKVKWKGRRVKN